MVGWDVEQIFRLAGGSPGVVKLCAAMAPLDVPPSPATVAMWKFRGRISARWVPVLVRGLGLKGFSVKVLTRELAPGTPALAEDVGL